MNESLTCEAPSSAQCTPWHMEGICCPKWDCDEREWVGPDGAGVGVGLNGTNIVKLSGNVGIDRL